MPDDGVTDGAGPGDRDPDGVTSGHTASASDTTPAPVENLETIDLIASTGPAAARRIIPVVAAVALVVVAFLVRRRRNGS